MRRKTFVLCLVVLLITTGLCAQQDQFIKKQDQPVVSAPLIFNPSFLKRAFFRPVKYQLEAPPSLKDYAVDGKLTLTLEDVVRLVVQRNTDVWLARLDLQNADTAVMRSYSTFDPSFTSSFNSNRSSKPSTNTYMDASSSLNQTASFGYTQALPTGTSYTVSFNGGKSSSDNSGNRMNPTISTGLTVDISQPLLRGRGFFAQRSGIIVAKIGVQTARRTFETNLTRTLVDAMNQYWAVVQARESLAIAQRAFKMSDDSYKLDKRKLELGALPPLDIFSSQADRARAEVQVQQNQFQLAQQEDVLRRIIAADLDPEVRNLPLNLTDLPTPSSLLEVKTDEQIAKAVANDPSLDILHRQQAIDDINVRMAMNNLKPQLDLTGRYVSNGIGGNMYSDGVLVPGGFIDAMSQLFNFNAPTYQFGLRFNFPIRDRRRTAEYADSLISQKRDIYKERQTVQAITLNVKNAVSRLEQAKATMKTALIARDLANENVKAENKKYELGAEIMINVLLAQQRLAEADLAYMNATISYRQAVVALQQVTATLLDENNVVLDQAMKVSQPASVKQVLQQNGGAASALPEKKN